MINGNKGLTQKWEPWLFYLVAALHLFPLFTLHFFPTVDGAAHIYNSRLINGLLLSDPVYESFYAFNTVPEPNWLGHAVLSILNMIFPALIAEKILVAICIVCLPIAFRRLVLKMNPAAAFGSYLIFPFIYSFMFITGFYNFCLSLPLLFWAVSYWMKVKDTLRARQMIVFSLFILLLFFCHMFAFGLVCVIAGALLLPVIRTQGIRTFFIKAGRLVLMALPSIALAAYFMHVHHTDEPGIYFEKNALLKMLYGIQPIMTHSYEEPGIFAVSVFYLICLLFILAIACRLRERCGIRQGDIWLPLSFAMLLAYFFLPDATAGGGFISLRLSYYFFVFLLIWICTVRMPRLVAIPAAAIAVIASLGFVVSFYDQLKAEDKEAQEYFSIAEHIEEGAVVMPLKYVHGWRSSHYSNYLAYEKSLIILENYEATSALFPVVWKNNYEPFAHMGDIVRVPPCANISNYTAQTQKQINYIVQWKYVPSDDSCALAIQREIETNYKEKFRSANGNAVLFERKK